MKIAIDGDIYAYQYAASNEEWMEVDGWLLPHFDMRLMRQQWEQFVEEQIPRCDEFVVCFTDSVNFRKSVCPQYKNKRGVKPIPYKPFKEWITQNYRVEIWPTLEADDVLGILCTRDNFVIVSEDKDLKTIPGWHYDLKTQETRGVTQSEADLFWMTQTLTGDAVDGYSGLPGCGPKTAEKLLAGTARLQDMWPRVVEAYGASGLTEADAIKQARLARILRNGDYDEHKKEVKLWTP